MRGKEDDEEESSEPTGITPTYAGKSDITISMKALD